MARKKKLNTKFLLVVVCVIGLLGLGVGGLVVWKQRHRDPKTLLAIANSLMAQGNYAEGARHLSSAAMALKDPAMMVKAGDVYWSMVYSDPEDNIKAARDLWRFALQTDPTYTPALTRLLDDQIEAQAIWPRDSGLYENMRQYAEKIRNNDPDNKQAKAALPLSVVRAWMAGVETEPQKVREAQTTLADLEKSDPQNPELPSARASVVMRLAKAGLGENNDLKAAAEEGKQIIEAALSRMPDDAQMHFTASQFFFTLSREPAAGDPKAATDRARAEIARAAELAKPADKRFSYIVAQAGEAKIQAGDAAGDEKILRDALAKKPSDLPLRQALAQLISADPNRRDEVIQILSEPVTLTPEERSGWAGYTHKGAEDVISVDLAMQRLMKYDALAADAASPDAQAQRKQLMAQAEQALAGLVTRFPNSPHVLRLKGRILASKGQVIDATQAYTKAVQAAGEDQNSAIRVQASAELAQLLMRSNQLGQAETLLTQLVKETNNDQLRRYLIDVLVRNNKLDDAREQVDVLAKGKPDSPDIVRLRVLTSDPKTQKDQIAKLYQQLPEQTRPQRLDKAMLAMRPDLGLGDNVPRLLQGLLKDDAGDADAARMLANYYATQKNDKTQALAVLDAALKAKPENAALEFDRRRLAAQKPEEVQQLQREEIAKLPPFEREMAMSQLEAMNNNIPVAIQHAKEAEKLEPKNAKPMRFIFAYAVAQKDWATAQAYVDKMSDPQVNADGFGGLSLRWELARAQGDLNKALELATELTRDRSEFAQSYIALGTTLQAMGRHEDAIFNLVQARDKQPNNPEIYDALIRSAYALNRPSEAKKYIDDAQKNLRGVPAVEEWAVNYEVRYGDPEKVLAQREERLKQRPDDPDAYLTLSAAYASTGERRTQAGKPDEAKQFFTKARDVLTQALAKWPEVREFTNNYAAASLALKDVEGGEKAWKTLLARPEWKDKPQGLLLLADYYAAAGPDHLPQAEQTLRDALAKVGGANADLQLRLAAVLLSEKKPEDALAVLSSGASDDPRIVSRRGEILINTGKDDQAEQVLTTAQAGYVQRGQPVPSDLLNQLALVYARTKREPKAVETLNQLLAQDPKNAGALYQRANLTGQKSPTALEDAIKDLTLARDVNPNFLDARYRLADYLGRKRDGDGRIRELESILSIDPAQRPARMMLIEAYSNGHRWPDVERLLADARKQPGMANDVKLLDIEAKMWAQRGDSNRALEKFTIALRNDPENTDLLRTYYGLLLQAKKYQKVIDDSGPNLRTQTAAKLAKLWWLHRSRGEAYVGLKQNDQALQEFNTALEMCFAANDQGAADVVVSSMAQGLGADSVLKALDAKIKSGDPRWLMIAASLQMSRQRVKEARELMEQVMAKIDTFDPAAQAQVLSFTASLYMIDPDQDQARAKTLYERVVAMQPDNYLAWNNLASNKLLKPEESLAYSTKAFKALQDSGVSDDTTVPYIKDTHGWNLVQVGRIDEGLSVLMEAWQAKQFPDLAYHIGETLLKQNKPDEAEKYLTDAGRLFGEWVEKKMVTDLKLQDDINTALQQARDLKAKQASGAGN